MAKNIPVIASGVEGPMDIMDTKKVLPPFSPAPGGVLVDYKKPSERVGNLFKAFKYVFDNPEKISRSVQKGRKKTLKKYAWEALVKRKLNVYHKV